VITRAHVDAPCRDQRRTPPYCDARPRHRTAAGQSRPCFSYAGRSFPDVGPRHVELDFLEYMSFQGTPWPTAPTMQMRRGRAQAQSLLGRRLPISMRRHDGAITPVPLVSRAPLPRRCARDAVVRRPARGPCPRAGRSDRRPTTTSACKRTNWATNCPPDEGRSPPPRAQLDARRAHRIHRDTAQRGEQACRQSTHRHPRRQVAPHQDGSAMPRAFARTRPVRRFEDPSPSWRPPDSGATVAQHRVLVNLRAPRHGGHLTGLHGHVPDLAQVPTDCRPPRSTGCPDGCWPSRFALNQRIPAAATSTVVGSRAGREPRPR